MTTKHCDPFSVNICIWYYGRKLVKWGEQVSSSSNNTSVQGDTGHLPGSPGSGRCVLWVMYGVFSMEGGGSVGLVYSSPVDKNFLWMVHQCSLLTERYSTTLVHVRLQPGNDWLVSLCCNHEVCVCQNADSYVPSLTTNEQSGKSSSLSTFLTDLWLLNQTRKRP